MAASITRCRAAPSSLASSRPFTTPASTRMPSRIVPPERIRLISRVDVIGWTILTQNRRHGSQEAIRTPHFEPPPGPGRPARGAQDSLTWTTLGALFLRSFRRRFGGRLWRGRLLRQRLAQADSIGRSYRVLGNQLGGESSDGIRIGEHSESVVLRLVARPARSALYDKRA